MGYRLAEQEKRQEQKAFVVEGNKSIQEYLLADFSPIVIYGTTQSSDFSVQVISEHSMKRMSSLKIPLLFWLFFQFLNQ